MLLAGKALQDKTVSTKPRRQSCRRHIHVEQPHQFHADNSARNRTELLNAVKKYIVFASIQFSGLIIDRSSHTKTTSINSRVIKIFVIIWYFSRKQRLLVTFTNHSIQFIRLILSLICGLLIKI